ncbi:MltR family transcriptional regulator [Hoeflea sp.]|uniref:MltR family transcriptional regulator n=1 Tax=Hoeflea sp. TaxID=1940281 RepID=UPI003BB04B71
MQPSHLDRSDDRAAAIIVSTHLEDDLKEFILSKMVPLTQSEIGEIFIGDSPISTFSAKINLAYALGLIGKQARHDLSLIRHIRNTFAHSRKPISFATNEVADTCKHLTLLDRHQEPRFQGRALLAPRDRFVATAQLYRTGIMCTLRPELFNLEDEHQPQIPLD